MQQGATLRRRQWLADMKRVDHEDDAPPMPKGMTFRRGRFAGGGRDKRSLYIVFVTVFVVSLAIRLLRPKGILPDSYALCSKEGGIYTVDIRAPQVECIVVRNAHIHDIGSIDDVRKRWGDRDRTGPTQHSLSSERNGVKFIYVKPGQIVVPGLTDAHAHVLEYGYKRHLEVDGCKSVAEVLERLRNYVTSHPDVLNDTSAWIQGMGWDQTRWPGSVFPTKDDFDKEPLLLGRPIYLRRVDGHAIWVSSKVLELAGDLPDVVDGGVIVKDVNGKPTGVFVDNAMSLIVPPAWSDKQMSEYFSTTMKEALSVGLTSIHDAATSPQMIEFFKRVADGGHLPLRLYLMGNVESSSYWGDQIPRLTNYGRAGRLNLRSAKLFADGALGSWGAALREPYTDRPEISGLLLHSPGDLSNLVKQFWRDGFQVNIHCIGDRANEVVLDIFEELLQGQNVTERRPRIEHAQIVTDDDAKRMSELGVIPSVQPTHATSDMWYAETRLGPERVKTAYAYGKLLHLSTTGVLPLGSDFPVEGINPLLGFYAAVSRLSPSGDSPHGSDGWFPEQRLTRAEALKGMTLDPAYASFAEGQLGSLSPGKRADFVVLDTDIMTVPVPEILQAKVVATMIDGRPMYGKLWP